MSRIFGFFFSISFLFILVYCMICFVCAAIEGGAVKNRPLACTASQIVPDILQGSVATF